MNNLSVVIPVPPPSAVVPADGGDNAGAQEAPPLIPFWLSRYEAPSADVRPEVAALMLLAQMNSDTPEIGPPLGDCAAETWDEYVQHFASGSVQKVQERTAKEGLKTYEKKLQDQHAESKRKYDSWVKQCKRAQNKGCGALGWIKRIAMPLATLGAAVATAATFGAASPLLALTIAMTAYSMAQIATEEAGGPSIGLADNLNKGLKSAGLDDATASLTTGIIGGVSGANLLDPSFAGHFVGGSADMAGADAETVAMLHATATAVSAVAGCLVTMKMTDMGTSATKVAEASVKAGLNSAARAADDVAEVGAKAADDVANAVSKTTAKADLLDGTVEIAKHANRLNAASELTDGGATIAKGAMEIELINATRGAQLASADVAMSRETEGRINAMVSDFLRQLGDIEKRNSELYAAAVSIRKANDESNLHINTSSPRTV